MELGAFSISLSVKDLEVSKSFYEKLGFRIFGGDAEQNWLIMKNADHTIGLFQGAAVSFPRRRVIRFISIARADEPAPAVRCTIVRGSTKRKPARIGPRHHVLTSKREPGDLNRVSFPLVSDSCSRASPVPAHARSRR